jgi:hypothetical protein
LSLKHNVVADVKIHQLESVKGTGQHLMFGAGAPQQGQGRPPAQPMQPMQPMQAGMQQPMHPQSFGGAMQTVPVRNSFVQRL